ncbi:MAG: transcription termination factor NusA [Candidatus Omnitrophica bacterium]|nr:transcription termination factor NusA [Candidatus Omnitrophota bacterium]MDD5080481.1 transcription termination factor NusA [Candidatus Omnitrophota bacterium]MDD5440741.1 transcription termination factor NusA [Candidatus Omnitrophota bacterium]
MNKEFLSIIEQLQREKGVNKEVLLDAVKTSLIVAAKKIIKFNTGEEPEDVTAEIDPLTGDMCVQVEGKEFVSGEFGRIAAQTARQVIIQKIREAEKDNVYNDFKDKEGDIISGVVYRIEKKAVIVDIMGRGEGIIPNSFLSPLDNPRMGERMKAYVYEVKRDRGVQIILSRKHEGLVKKLFELEVPEIFESIVEIKSIAREAGERTKIAVFSKEEKVDCVGACVGIRGARVKSIIEELRGEKIDVVRWNDDIKEFIKEALSPATISQIELDRENKRAKVIATPEQLSLAIGKRGQNVRLASKLVGWEIDVRSKESIEAAIKTIGKMKSLGKKGTESVVESGYNSIEAIAKTTEEKLAKIKGISSNKAKQIIEEAKELIENTKNKED